MEFASIGLDLAIKGLTGRGNPNTIGADSDGGDESRWNGSEAPQIICKEGRDLMATLRKGDITASVAAKLGGSRAQGEAALNAVLSSVQESLRRGNRVVLTGFGSFSIREVKARRVKPIRGGQAGMLITVPAHKRVGFTAGAELNKAAQR